MGDAERWWVVTSGVIGLAAFVAGARLAAPPAIDAGDADVVADLQRRRTTLLAGAALGGFGVCLMLWPLAAVAAAPVQDGWAALGPASLAAWTLGLAILAVASFMPAALAWRDPAAVPAPVVRLVLDLAHLAVWSLSAPAGAVATVTTTAAAVRSEMAHGATAALLIGVAVAKVATVVVELAGTGRRTGWNAGGWAGGASGYVTVAWFSALLLALALALG